MYTIRVNLIYKAECWNRNEWSIWRKLWFLNHYIFPAQCRRPEIFQTINSNWTNYFSLKYQRFIPLSFKDKGIIAMSLWQRLNSFMLCLCVYSTNSVLNLNYEKHMFFAKINFYSAWQLSMNLISNDFYSCIRQKRYGNYF